MSADAEAKFGNKFPLSHALHAWILRHAGWLTDRFLIGKDAHTAFQRYKGKAHNGEMCELFETVLWKVPTPEAHKLEDRFDLGLWTGKTSRGDDHNLKHVQHTNEIVELGGCGAGPHASEANVRHEERLAAGP